MPPGPRRRAGRPSFPPPSLRRGRSSWSLAAPLIDDSIRSPDSIVPGHINYWMVGLSFRHPTACHVSCGYTRSILVAGLERVARPASLALARRAFCNGTIVEANICRIAGSCGIRTIGKVPQSPSGMTYIGSITIPFTEFSYVVKVQCFEHGVTGAREAVLMDRAQRVGTPIAGRKNHWRLGAR